MAKTSNSPEVEHRLAEVGKNDAQAEHREALKAALVEEKAAVEARFDRALAMAAPIQPVLDGNETAALATITGQKPMRDMSNAPPPVELGPHESGGDSPEAKKVDAEVKKP